MKISNIRTKASALVISLAFLVLITMLVVGLMETVRTERASANSHLAGLGAEFYAQAAIERAVATIQLQTAPQQSGTNQVNNWISQPGQLRVADAESKGKPTQPVYLSSGPADAELIAPGYTDAAYFRPPDLNIPTFRSPTNHLISEYKDAITGNTIQMPVAWIYVRESGTLVFESRPDTKNATDPIVGRYAYWTDDESSKINYNLAWGRTTSNTKPAGDPSRIDLTALQPLLSGNGLGSDAVSFKKEWAEQLHKFIFEADNGTAAHGFYNTPEDARQVPNSDLAAALKAYKFELTHYNSDPNTTFFNEPRIVLTTQLSRVPKKADGQPAAPYIDILASGQTNPGKWSSLDTGKLNKTINKLISYLQRTDWPMVDSEQSFQSKYYNSNANRLTQLALNIIDYVRSKESSDAVIEPIRGEKPNLTTDMTVEVATNANGFIGIGRTPCINELGVWISGASNGKYTVILKMEVHLPTFYGLSQLDLRKYKISQLRIGYSDGTRKTLSSDQAITNITKVTNPPFIKAGEYALVTATFPITITQWPNGRPVGSVKCRVALAKLAADGGKVLDVVPLLDGGDVDLPVDDPGVPDTDIRSSEVDDPRVNKHPNDWKMRTSGNSFGEKNLIYLSAPLPVIPEQDTDSTGASVSNASLYMPPPAGLTSVRPDGDLDDNTDGVVTSIGELGYICTGMESCAKSGIPWRSLRLQPSKAGNSTVPDWALMDLFTVPVTVDPTLKSISQPNDTSYGGRVNVNSHVQPFSLKRILPLAAVIQNCPYRSGNAVKLNVESAQTIATNIFDRTLAENGNLYGFQDGYYSPGEIVEIKGVADAGEESEELVRQIANLITARGNVFTIYSVGESIKQTPTGTLITTGQRRLQSMVERYVDKESTWGAVRFRTVYYRNLTP